MAMFSSYLLEDEIKKSILEEVKEELKAEDDIEKDDSTEEDFVECKEYADFIDKHFLAGFLNEDASEIISNINELKMKDSIDLNDITDVMVKMEGSDVSDIVKLEVMNQLVDLYEEWVDAEGEVADHSLLEYAGNAEKNRLFRQIMVEMEKMFAQYYAECDFVITSLDKIVSICEKEAAKKSPNAKAAALECKKVFDKVNSELTKDEAKDYIKKYNITWSKIKSLAGKFSIKFSDVVMEDKKAFDKKLEAAAKKVTENKKFTSWLPTAELNGTEKVQKLNKALDTLGVDSHDAVVKIASEYTQPIYGYGYQCLTGYIGNINFLRRKLGLEKEDTVFYRILNKVFKTKKSDKE